MSDRWPLPKSAAFAFGASAVLWAIVALIVLAVPAKAAEVAPPPGAFSFCLRFPAECAPSPPAQGGARDLAIAEAISARVDAATRPEDDEAHYGRAEFWTLISDGRGDCEDYALTKLHLMREDGIAPGALSIALVELRDQERHVVALVDVAGTIWAFDNLAAPAPLASRPYWVRAVRRFGDPAKWDSP